MSESATARVEHVRDDDLAALARTESPEDLEAWRIAFLGRRGHLTGLLRAVGSLPPDQRRAAGEAANRAKSYLESALAEREHALAAGDGSNADQDGAIDVTLPGCDMWNTLWLDYEDDAGETPMLLRTHTSPMQARIMEGQEPPVRVVVPGKCYRYEATDATHEWHFFQVEGLAVDRGITFADLKGTLYEFARLVFGQERRVRFRCDYFPFVEPGVDMSIDCFACAGGGCRICGETGWIEIMGAGMVHPKVLEGVGYDPNIYTGFAFGMGPERIAMLKYGIDDIRLFYANDLRFLSQF